MGEQRCAVGQPLSPVADRPLELHRDDGIPHEQFGLNLGSRRASETRWPQGWLCHAVKVVEQTTHAGYLMEISLPVYAPDGQRAALYWSHMCGPLCGSGQYVELRKVDGEWRISSTAPGTSS